MSLASSIFNLPGGLVLSLDLKPYALPLKTTFGTNALISVSLGAKTGYGECGLPPKKPGVYLADLLDVQGYFFSLQSFILASVGKYAEASQYDPFGKLESQWFATLRTSAAGAPEEAAIRFLFSCTDSNPANSDKSSRVCRNGIEMALLDLWGKVRQSPLYKLIGIEPTPKACFYTVGLNVDNEVMLKSGRDGLVHTPFLKIKLNRDVKKGTEVLEALHKQTLAQTSHFSFSIDANADWTPEVTSEFLRAIVPWKESVYMFEQPFPAHMEPSEKPQWEKVKEECGKAGVLIYADESVATVDDVEFLKDIVHGVNIKLDKTGGIREALKTVTAAKKAGLAIWIGIMVSSRLSTSAASHILPLATLGGDLDGQLLIVDSADQFTEGLQWDKKTGMVHPNAGLGIGVCKK